LAGAIIAWAANLFAGDDAYIVPRQGGLSP